MHSFRNFIYNISDIVVALIIILVAALIIWFRVEVIMDYPDNDGGIIHKGVQVVAAIADGESVKAAVKDVSKKDDGNDAIDTSGVEAAGEKVDTSQTETAQTDQKDEGSVSEVKVSEAGVQYKEVYIPSGCSSDVVAGLLKNAGLITSTNDFLYSLSNLGYEGAVMPGTHNVPVGSSMSELIKILCGVYEKQEAQAADTAAAGQ